MPEKRKTDKQKREGTGRRPERADRKDGNGRELEFRVEDRRHWADDSVAIEESDEEQGSIGVKQPTLLDEYRQRAESAERKLQEYIEAFKSFKDEQEKFRERLSRDVARKVELEFGRLVGELLESMDDLDLALDHASKIPEAEPLSRGVELARTRFLAALERAGIERVSPDGNEFDPNEAEAVRVDPVDSSELEGTVTETLRPGYRLGERVIRAAKVAVGRHDGS